MKKKLIILGILFLFGFGVFFGTFARGGYLVNAADLNTKLLGSYETVITTQNGENVEAIYELHADSETDYYLSIKLWNYVYSYIYEDYHIFSTMKITFMTDTDGLGFSLASSSATDFQTFTPYNTIVDQKIDVEGDIYLEIIIEYDLSASQGTPAYLNIYSEIASIFLDTNNGIIDYDDEVWDEKTFYCYSYNTAYNLYNSGYDVGYTEGYTDGHTDGYGLGHSEGYTEGYTDGTQDGYDVGYTEGYTDGHTDGYGLGHSEGHTEGYTDGYVDGEYEGYLNGFQRGTEETETAKYWFTGLFDGMQRFLNIEIMGISIGTIVLVPFAISFVWFIIRQFRGGGD